jgi:hypothetical protein
VRSGQQEGLSFVNADFNTNVKFRQVVFVKYAEIIICTDITYIKKKPEEFA